MKRLGFLAGLLTGAVVATFLLGHYGARALDRLEGNGWFV